MVTYLIFTGYECKSTTNKVEVYDGLPSYLSSPTAADENESLGVFCLNDPYWKGKKLVAASGTMTIHYVCQDSTGFNASFQIFSCPWHCPDADNRMCSSEDVCICKEGFAGDNCRRQKCPAACGAGYCNAKTNLCECTAGYTGDNCTQKALGQLEEKHLFDLDILPKEFQHYKVQYFAVVWVKKPTCFDLKLFTLHPRNSCHALEIHSVQIPKGPCGSLEVCLKEAYHWMTSEPLIAKMLHGYPSPSTFPQRRHKLVIFTQLN